jgi:putative endopeptidase
MEQLAAINAVADRKELSAIVGKMHVESSSPFFGFYIGADEKNSTMNLLQFYQGGISMSDRDYYLLKDENTLKIRGAYRKYIDRLFTLAGYNAEEASKAADAVLALETEIAEISVDRATLRDVHKNYNKMPLKEFTSRYDFLDWNEFFKETGISKSTELNAGQIPFFEGLTEILKKTSLEDQKLYLAFKLLNAASSYLSDDFINANFDFYGRALQGKEELQPRWKSSLAVVNRSLAEAFGQMYVEKYFPASSKEKMIEMVANLQTALGERIEALEWMSAETKSKAKEKLGTFIVKVGYPDNWKDYTALEIKNDSYWANICRANVFAHNDMMQDEGQPVDRTEWAMSPQTVNAYYNPTTNEICFPAAILQPPLPIRWSARITFVITPDGILKRCI